MIIYYNPDCSKCNEALGLLQENNCEVQIRNYLADPPTEREIIELIKMLGCKPSAIVRTKEPLFVEKFEGKEISEQEWPRYLAEFPVLIERPIVVEGKTAIIGRPPTLVLELLK
jgi:arsenate reductase